MALGKGLGALITPTTTNKKNNRNIFVGAEKGKVWEIPITSIETNPDQPRKNFDPKKLDELAESIKEHGILQPLLVVEKENGKYELVAGERRLRASKIAGLADVPAMVKELEEEQKLEVALIENIQRQDLNPLEEAFSYLRLIEEFGLTQQQVAQKVGKARPTIANMIRLLELPEEIKKALVDEKIGISQAKTLLALKTDKERLEMMSSMFGEKITVNELERKISKKKGETRRNPNIVYLEDELRSSLGTKVIISERKGKGKISIEFYSEEELKELVQKLKQ